MGLFEHSIASQRLVASAHVSDTWCLKGLLCIAHFKSCNPHPISECSHLFTIERSCLLSCSPTMYYHLPLMDNNKKNRHGLSLDRAEKAITTTEDVCLCFILPRVSCFSALCRTVSLVQCITVVTSNFLFLRKLSFKAWKKLLQQNLNLITRILKQTVGLQQICGEDFIVNIKGKQ